MDDELRKVQNRLKNEKNAKLKEGEIMKKFSLINKFIEKFLKFRQFSWTIMITLYLLDSQVPDVQSILATPVCLENQTI